MHKLESSRAVSDLYRFSNIKLTKCAHVQAKCLHYLFRGLSWTAFGYTTPQLSSSQVDNENSPWTIPSQDFRCHILRECISIIQVCLHNFNFRSIVHPKFHFQWLKFLTISQKRSLSWDSWPKVQPWPLCHIPNSGCIWKVILYVFTYVGCLCISVLMTFRTTRRCS